MKALPERETLQPTGMAQLLHLLCCDLARQLELEGRPEVRPDFSTLLRRSLHPRFLPIVLCRASRAARLAHVPVLPELLTYLNIVLFGLEVTPRCEIAPGIFFPHPSGTVVGAWRIGRNATILQGVTLGAKTMDLGFDPGLRPEIGDHVVVGAGAKVLGGIRIGDNVTVGANSVVLASVEAGVTVAGVPALPLSKKAQPRPATLRTAASEGSKAEISQAEILNHEREPITANEERGMNNPEEKQMESLLDLTVIIPSYNTRRLLGDCLSSIYRHTRDLSFEVICLDDNSGDGSADMVAEAFPGVILVRNQANYGYVRNTNLGMRMSRARYACHLNSDTLLISNAFRALVGYMDENPGVAACGPKLLNPDRSVQHCIRHFSGPATMVLQALNWHKLFPRSPLTDRYYATRFDYSKAQPVDSIGTTAYVIRRSTWENAGMLDERFRLFVSDLAYNFMLKEKGYPVHYTPCAEIVHFGSQSVNQEPQSSLRELHHALIEFNEAYDYFGKSRASKLLVRLSVKARDYLKRAEYYLGSDKRVIKGPGAPPKARAKSEAKSRAEAS